MEEVDVVGAVLLRGRREEVAQLARAKRQPPGERREEHRGQADVRRRRADHAVRPLPRLPQHRVDLRGQRFERRALQNVVAADGEQDHVVSGIALRAELRDRLRGARAVARTVDDRDVRELLRDQSRDRILGPRCAATHGDAVADEQDARTLGRCTAFERGRDPRELVADAKAARELRAIARSPLRPRTARARVTVARGLKRSAAERVRHGACLARCGPSGCTACDRAFASYCYGSPTRPPVLVRRPLVGFSCKRVENVVSHIPMPQGIR